MKKRTIIAIIFSVLPGFPVSLHAGTETAKKDSIYLLQRLLENQSVYAEFFTLPYGNPAMKYRMYDHTLNEISAGGEYRRESEPLIMQTGDGHRYGMVDVKSFICKDRSNMWGEANYRNGRQMNLKWNETSDYLLLYPYVTGDTVGGDLKSEQYRFNGGYTARTGRFIWGADASYRATVGYRQTDPRPRNITGKLDFTLGLALITPGRYRPGISIHASKYKQKNIIKFYNQQGNITLYHFTGLGTDYYRFRGDEKETYYKGRQFGAGIDLLPENGNGFTAAISVDHFRFEKIISALNELPMARADEYTWKAETGYKQKSHHQAWGVKAEWTGIHRKGTENLFGDPVNGIYPQITSAQQYSNKRMEGSLSGFYENTGSDGFSWAVRPVAGFCHIKTRYIYPARRLENKRLRAALSLQAGKQTGKWLLRVNATVCYDAALAARLHLPENADEKNLVPLINSYRFLESDHTLLQTGLRSDYALGSRWALYISTRWQHGWYTGQTRTDHISAVIGVAF